MKRNSTANLKFARSYPLFNNYRSKKYHQDKRNKQESEDDDVKNNVFKLSISKKSDNFHIQFFNSIFPKSREFTITLYTIVRRMSIEKSFSMKKEIEIQTIPFSFPSPLSSFFSSTFSLSFYFLLFFSKNGNREQERKDLFSFYFPRPFPFNERTRAENKKRTKTRGKETGTLFVFISNFFPFREGRGDWEEEKARKILSFLIAEESISSPLFGILDLVNSTSSFGRIDTLSRVIPQA